MDGDEDDVKAALKTVEDPEAGMSVLDLGLVYAIALEPGKVRVQMTMTSPASTSKLIPLRTGRPSKLWCRSLTETMNLQFIHTRKIAALHKSDLMRN